MELKELQNKVLQKVGRNVINFQKFEAMIKLLAANGVIEGSVSNIKQSHHKKKNAISKKSMGNILEPYLKAVHENNSLVDSSDPIDEPWFSVSFTIEKTDEEISEIRKSLSRIVKERNFLMHKMFISYNGDSVESCQEMLNALDKQNDMLLPEFDKIRNTMILMNNLRQEFVNNKELGNKLKEVFDELKHQGDQAH